MHRSQRARYFGGSSFATVPLSRAKALIRKRSKPWSEGAGAAEESGRLEMVEPNMDMGDPRKIDSYIRSAVRILFSVGLAVLVILTGCSQDSSSRIHVELRDTPEAKPTAQTIPKADPSCPVGDLPDTDVQTVPSKSHSVTLSWNLSTSSNDLNGQNIRYCLYRAEGGPVQKNNTPSTYPCARCGRVTKTPVQGKTTDPDRNVENGVHYCYGKSLLQYANQCEETPRPPMTRSLHTFFDRSSDI